MTIKNAILFSFAIICLVNYDAKDGGFRFTPKSHAQVTSNVTPTQERLKAKRITTTKPAPIKPNKPENKQAPTPVTTLRQEEPITLSKFFVNGLKKMDPAVFVVAVIGAAGAICAALLGAFAGAGVILFSNATVKEGVSPFNFCHLCRIGAGF